MTKNKITLNNKITLSSQGPVTLVKNAYNLIHFRQGDLDGACGPYCMFMVFIILGLFTRAEAHNMHSWKGSTKKGKFRDALMAFGSLSSGGTYNGDLLWLTDFFKSEKVYTKTIYGNKQEVFGACIQAVQASQFPVIGVRWHGGGGHWLLVVGYQGYEKDGEDLQITHLLCLDPGQPAPKTSIWNAVIEVFDKNGAPLHKGKLTSEHWGMDGIVTKCQLDDAIIINRIQKD